MGMVTPLPGPEPVDALALALAITVGFMVCKMLWVIQRYGKYKAANSNRATADFKDLECLVNLKA